MIIYFILVFIKKSRNRLLFDVAYLFSKILPKKERKEKQKMWNILYHTIFWATSATNFLSCNKKICNLPTFAPPYNKFLNEIR